VSQLFIEERGFFFLFFVCLEINKTSNFQIFLEALIQQFELKNFSLNIKKIKKNIFFYKTRRLNL
jgi:hypothetical protein